MIFQFEQVTTNFDMSWFAVKNEKAFIAALAPFERGRLTVTIDYPGERKQLMYYNPSDTTYGATIQERLAFKLFEQNELAGTIQGMTQKVKGFLQSYAYRMLQAYGSTYYLYEVGFGNKGLYLCFYKDDQLIAIADKELKVVNYQDHYTVYALNEADLSAIVPLLLHYDITEHGDMMEVSLYSVKKKKVNTVQKQLLEKYDASFIEMVKQMEETSR